MPELTRKPDKAKAKAKAEAEAEANTTAEAHAKERYGKEATEKEAFKQAVDPWPLMLLPLEHDGTVDSRRLLQAFPSFFRGHPKPKHLGRPQVLVATLTCKIRVWHHGTQSVSRS